LALALVAWLLLAGDSRAAKDPPSTEKEVKELGKDVEKDVGKEDHGKPSLFGWAMDLAIWTIVVFLILLGVLWKFAWGPLLQGLEKREHDIHAAHEDARKAREEADVMRRKLQEEMNQAQSRVREMLEQGRKDSERLHQEMRTQAQADIQAERERLQREMRMEYDRARQEIRTQVAQVATLISAKVLRRQLNPDDHRHLIDEALADLRQTAGHDGILAGS
jgi:F-type H+-transporting ATPase subunit b